jgi:two-component system NtrC family sensor kinase
MMAAEHILVIDDSVAITALLANEILPLGGYRVTAAHSGEEGLEMVETLRPDLILCDLEMPDITGLELLQELQQKRADVPSIMMTAFGSEAVATQALRIGVKDYIVKPFTTDEILASIDRALAERRLKAKLAEANAALDECRQALVVMQAVSQAVGAGLDPESLLSRIILAAVYGGKAEGGFIAGFDAPAGRLDVKAVANLPKWQGRQIEVKSDRGLSQALSTRDTVSSESTIGHWIHIPLVREGVAIGVMSLVGKAKEYPQFVESLSVSLASLAAFVLENVRLRAELAVAMLQGKQQA